MILNQITIPKLKKSRRLHPGFYSWVFPIMGLSLSGANLGSLPEGGHSRHNVLAYANTINI